MGNHPPFCSIEAAQSLDDNLESIHWIEILNKSPLNPGNQNFFKVKNINIWTHVKLHIYPDGGVARLKVYGEVRKDWNLVSKDQTIDLASAINGAKSILCNDMFFSHMDNLIMPGRGVNMGDGWETKRNRTPTNKDWVIIRLAHKGIIDRIKVDTHHFKGNYPESCMIEVCFSSDDNIMNATWRTILPRVKLSADKEHVYENELLDTGICTHARLSIFPDGGISRLRLFGRITKDE